MFFFCLRSIIYFGDLIALALGFLPVSFWSIMASLFTWGGATVQFSGVGAHNQGTRKIPPICLFCMYVCMYVCI